MGGICLFVCVQECECAGGARRGEVNDTLIARAAEMKGEITFLCAVVTVDENVELIEQGIYGGILLCAQLLEGVACVAPYVETARVCSACKREQCCGL